MERYWDERAQEDPFHYVDNREQLGSPNQEAFWAGGEQVVEQLFEDLGVSLNGDEDVVEIGCGIGRLTRALAHRARSVQALDVSQVMLEHARSYNPALGNVHWIHCDGTTLAPLPDGSFDACVSFVVFQHLPDPNLTYGYVREMGRVLRPGGWAAFQVSNDPTIHLPPTGFARLRAWGRGVLKRGPRTHNAAWRGSAVDLTEVERAAGDGGLEVQRVKDPGSLFCFVLARRVG
jgi:SAM-dependent methyltransferase